MADGIAQGPLTMPGRAPAVSVGIPVFNNARTVATAVRSVLAQRFADFELVVVDDGSTDGSLEVVRAIDDPRLEVVADGRNLGLVARLNQLTSMSTGRYVARMDADDICHPDRLGRQVEWLDANPAAMVVATAVWIIDEHDNVTGVRHRNPMPAEPGAPLGHGLLVHPTVMARHEFLVANPYDPAYERAEDKELWARTWHPARYGRLTEPLLFYREATVLRPAAYRTGCRSDRRLIRRYGPQLEGRAKTVARLGRSLAVEGATLGLDRVGLFGAVRRLRNAPLDDADRAEAVEALTATLAATR